MIARERGKKMVMLAAAEVTDEREVKRSGGGKAALPDFLKNVQFVALAGLTPDETETGDNK